MTRPAFASDAAASVRSELHSEVLSVTKRKTCCRLDLV
jgi:hypothetical protein